MEKENKKLYYIFVAVVMAAIIALCVSLAGCTKKVEQTPTQSKQSVSVTQEIPKWNGKPFVVLNDNIPQFSEEMLALKEAEVYSELDRLGRCGPAYAVITRKTMPTEPRGKIGMVKPSGWQTVRYDDLIKDRYLYNRCHLIGFQLAGENANPKNLITGTRSLNVDGMLPFENMVTAYVKKTGNPVLYRVVPVFHGDELVARGVTMEGYSMNDKGKSICFNVFIPNVQPGIVINYNSGKSARAKSK